MSASTIRTSLKALHAAVADDPAQSGVQVIQGQPGPNLEPDVITVGFTADEPSVQAEPLADDLKGQREKYGIVCLASSWRGDTDPDAVLDRAFDMLDAVHAMLKADPTLGGAVARAHLTAREFDQAQVNEGASATVKFTVHCDAFLR